LKSGPKGVIMADIVRVEEDSPERCQGVNRQGQCLNKREPGSDYCIAHGGNKGREKMEKESLKNYRLTKFQAQIQKYVDSPNIKCLRDEVGILRVLMEEKLNQCSDAKDLIYQSGPISDLVIKIEKLVTSCHKLEGSMGSLLDKQAIIQFGSELITLISSEIKDEEVLASISQKLLTLINKTIGEEETNA